MIRGRSHFKGWVNSANRKGVSKSSERIDDVGGNAFGNLTAPNMVSFLVVLGYWGLVGEGAGGYVHIRCGGCVG